MTSWRDRLCGSEVMGQSGEQNAASISLDQYVSSSTSLSCGGGHFPANINPANMKTFKGTFLLPTQDYAVLVFRDDGSAVIYSDTESTKACEDPQADDGTIPSVC